jgi:YggT family protein
MNFIATFIRILVDALTIAIIARVIISWFPVNPGNRFVDILHQVTEPILAPLRGIIPRVGMIDITPMIAIILLRVIAGLV